MKPEIRYVLCRGLTHEQVFQPKINNQITRDTKAQVKVKGKYRGPGDRSSERPLYLHITADTKESLDAAIAYIEQIINADAANQNVFY